MINPRRAAKLFSENEQGLRQMGIKSPEELRAHVEGRKLAKATEFGHRLPEGRGISDKFSEQLKSPRGQWAGETFDSFAESFKQLGEDKPTFVGYMMKLDDQEFAAEQKKWNARRRLSRVS
jgi:hypothetical protein